MNGSNTRSASAPPTKRNRMVGRKMDNVYPKLEQLGFRGGKIKRVKGENGEMSGTVLETAPKEGDYLKPDTKIDFVIVD